MDAFDTEFFCSVSSICGGLLEDKWFLFEVWSWRKVWSRVSVTSDGDRKVNGQKGNMGDEQRVLTFQVNKSKRQKRMNGKKSFIGR